LGAIQRHMIEGRNWGGVGVHVLGALVVLWAAFRVVEPALHEGETSPRYRRVALWIGGLLGLQILLGLFAVVVTRGDGGYVNAQDATSLIPTLHTLNGAAILALAVAAAIVANEDVETPAART
jgi:heme A synthase